jgi:hypothetical protein
MLNECGHSGRRGDWTEVNLTAWTGIPTKGGSIEAQRTGAKPGPFSRRLGGQVQIQLAVRDQCMVVILSIPIPSLPRAYHRKSKEIPKSCVAKMPISAWAPVFLRRIHFFLC